MARQVAPKSGIVWDLDGTLYENTDAMHQAWLDGFYQTVLAHGINLTREEADRKTLDGFKTHGHAVRAYGLEYGLDEDAFCQQLLNYVTVGLVNPCPYVGNHFAANSHIPHAILTSGHREWALPVLRHIGLHHLFAPERVIGYQDTNGELKSKSERPFRAAARALGQTPEMLIMVEDTPANLVIARDLGMATVLVTHGTPPETVPTHVDFVVDKAYDVFRLIEQGLLPWHTQSREKQPFLQP